MGSEGESGPSKLARLARVARLLLMTSGAAAVSWGALLTDIGGSVTQRGWQYAQRFAGHARTYLVAPRPAPAPIDAAPALREPLDPYRPAWYRWLASDHEQGDQVPSLGPFNMIVLTGGGPGLTGSAAAPAEVSFSFEPLSDISVSVRVALPAWTGQRIALFSGRTELTAVEFSESEIAFGDHREHYTSAGCLGERDEVTLTLRGGTARLWCNGRFVGIQTVRRLPLSQLRVSGLVRKRDYIYSVIAHAGAD
jgi:hypothetical protein